MSLKTEWIFNVSCVLLIIGLQKIFKRSSPYPEGLSWLTSFWRKLFRKILKKIKIFVGKMECILLNIFLAQSLSTSENTFSIKVGEYDIQHFGKEWKFWRKMPAIWKETKYKSMYQMQEIVKRFFRHF